MLSDRIRYHSEAAPWVLQEIKKLEDALRVGRDALQRVKPQVRGALPVSDVQYAIDLAERLLQ